LEKLLKYLVKYEKQPATQMPGGPIALANCWSVRKPDSYSSGNNFESTSGFPLQMFMPKQKIKWKTIPI
jgi:hypothetical protein